MKIVAIIPARYASSRLPGKPLADICGKPMIWWVYQKVKAISSFVDVICAIDDDRIESICRDMKINFIRTKDSHPDHISRVQEISNSINADYYVCINGDEPLISADCILPLLSGLEPHKTSPFFMGAMRKLNNPSHVIDPSNIKIVTTEFGRCLYLSRNPIPFPKGNLDFHYKKYVGVECFNKLSLDLFVKAPMSQLEKIEDIDHIRFLENNVEMFFTLVNSDSISVDTLKDLEYVRNIMNERIKNKEQEFYLYNRL